MISNSTTWFTILLFSVVDSCEVDNSPLYISSSFHDIETIESEMQEYVDRNHRFVQDLISANYPEEQSILAVQKFGTVEGAMEYLEQINEGDVKEDCRQSPGRDIDDKLHR